MKRSELMAYLLATVVGGAVAGQVAGLTGTLGVFAGVALVGYVEMLVVTSSACKEKGPGLGPFANLVLPRGLEPLLPP